jgi:hypothetical protein
MSDTDLKNASATQTKPVTSSWLSKHRILSAVLLHGLWKLRWYQTVFILWPMLIVAAWGASPYFMVYVVGMPEPGTAPRYVGTVRFEGELQRTKTGWIPPKYFIQTSNGEVEFHCGYLPYFRECGRFHGLTGGEHTADIYEVGYDPYWGVDYIKYPAWLTHLNADTVPKQVISTRLLYLERHFRSLMWFSFLLLLYFYLIWLTHQKSAPMDKRNLGGSPTKSSPPESNLLITEKQPSKLSPQSKPRRSFFD